MPTAVQFPSSDTAGTQAPAMTPFSLWFNAKDQHLWCSGADGSSRSLSPVRWWTSDGIFGLGELVVVGTTAKAIYRCTTATGPDATFPPSKFTIIAPDGGGGATFDGQLASALNAMVLTITSWATISSGYVAAAARMFSYDANAFILQLVSRYANSRIMQVVNSAGIGILSIREAPAVSPATSAGLEMFFNKDTDGTSQHYIRTGADPFAVFGGTSTARVGTNVLTVVGGLSCSSLIVGTGGISGIPTAGEWSSPIKMGADATPVYVWGHSGNVYRKATAPTSATDGTTM